MNTKLLEVQPRELKFTFESKKQSSCSIQLINKSAQYVAFKVKTTSPKKYCVRPNIGIIEPNSKRDFTVIMQAQRSAPPDLQCKDKFLIQSTVAPYGASEEDITPSMFAKDRGQFLEENKLKVVLVTPTNSPVPLPNNGMLIQEPPSSETIVPKDEVLAGAEDLPPPQTVAKNVDGFSRYEDMEELGPVKVVESKPAIFENEIKLKLAEDIEELKLKLGSMESKLSEAEGTITMLTTDRGRAIQEKRTLEQELAVLTRNGSVKRVQVGFPFLYVCMVALVSLTLGYVSRT